MCPPGSHLAVVSCIVPATSSDSPSLFWLPLPACASGDRVGWGGARQQEGAVHTAVQELAHSCGKTGCTCVAERAVVLPVWWGQARVLVWQGD